jgi:hypothetical protein
MQTSNKTITIWLGTVLWSLLPLAASAQQVVMTVGADLCSPVNVNKGIRVIQNIRGTVRNISADETINVSCPLHNHVDPNFDFFTLEAVVANFAPETQEVRCVLREIGLTNIDLQLQSRTVDLPSNGGAPIVFNDVVVTKFEGDPVLFLTSRFNMTCSLPPGGSIGLIRLFSG